MFWMGGDVRNIVRLIGHTGPVLSIRWSPDGKYLAAAGLDDRLLVWAVEGFECLHTLAGQSHLEWSPSSALLTVCHEGLIYIWDVATGRKEKQFQVTSSDFQQWNSNETFGILRWEVQSPNLESGNRQ
jgi:WD40 repeat protein